MEDIYESDKQSQIAFSAAISEARAIALKAKEACASVQDSHGYENWKWTEAILALIEGKLVDWFMH